MAIVIKIVGPGIGNEDPEDVDTGDVDSVVSSTRTAWSWPDVTIVLLYGMYPSALTSRTTVPLCSKKAKIPLSPVFIESTPQITVAPWTGFSLSELITRPETL
jgi:hypothetical protein